MFDPKELEGMGVCYRQQHFTGDNSYPTEHTLTLYNGESTIRGLGPTFDMALLDFIKELLKRIPPK